MRKIRQTLALLRVFVLNGRPERCRDDVCDLLQGEALTAYKIIENIGDDLGIGQKVAVVAVHLNAAAVRIVGRDFAVMDNGKVEQRKRVRTAPPAGGIRRVAAVRRPTVAGVFIETIEPTDILRVADGLKHAHVFAAGENIRAIDKGIDAVDAAGGELVFIELAFRKLCVQRCDEVPPDKRLVRDLRNLADRNFGKVHDVEMLVDELLTFLFCFYIIIENVERILFRIFRVNAVAGEAAAKAFERSCMISMERMISEPSSRFPLREKRRIRRTPKEFGNRPLCFCLL